MGFLSFLTGAKQADKALGIVEKATSGIVNGLDALVYTDEEKSAAGQKITDSHIKLMDTLANENTARAITRRIIAVMFCANFLALLDFALVAYVVGLIVEAREWVVVTAEKANPFVEAARFSKELALTLTASVAAIIVFYFGYYGVKSIVGAMKAKK